MDTRGAVGARIGARQPAWRGDGELCPRDRHQWEKVYDLFYVYLLTRVCCGAAASTGGDATD